MTHTSLISERTIFAVISGKFSDSPAKSHDALMELLKKTDPNFPTVEPGKRISLIWQLNEQESCVDAFYAPSNKVGTKKLHLASPEAAAVAASIISTAGADYAPELHGDLSVDALKAYAVSANPVHTAIEGYFDSLNALDDAKREALSSKEQALWPLWPHADMIQVLRGYNDEVARVKALPFELRAEAYAILAFSFAHNSICRSRALEIFPEGRSIAGGQFERTYTEAKKPLSKDGWEAAVSNRARMVTDVVGFMEDPTTVDLARFISDASSSEDSRIRALNIPPNAIETWILANLDSFPKVKPSDKDSVELYHWAIYASRTPELQAELEEEFLNFPKGIRILLLRQGGNAQLVMNDMLMRTAAVVKARQAAQAEK